MGHAPVSRDVEKSHCTGTYIEKEEESVAIKHLILSTFWLGSEYFVNAMGW